MVTKQDIKAKWSAHVLLHDGSVTTYHDKKLGISVAVTEKRNKQGSWTNKVTYRYRYIRDSEVREFKTMDELINEYNKD